MEFLQQLGQQFVIPASPGEFWELYGQGLITFALWLIAGYLVNILVKRALAHHILRDRAKVTRAIALSFKGLVVWIAGTIGFWIAFFSTPLTGELNQDISVGLKLVTALLTTAFLARLSGNLVVVYSEREGTGIPASSIFTNLVKVTVWILGIAWMFAILGISLTPIITALGVGGIAVGLALQPTLDNLFSGIQILASGQMGPGDYVRLESGQEGVIEDVTWRNTTIRQTSGNLVIVPNSVIGKSLIINFSRSTSAYSLVVTTTVKYGTDPALIERIAMEVAEQVMADAVGSHKDAEPAVSFVGIEPSGITFNTVLPVVSYEQRLGVRSMFVERLQKRLVAEGIEAPAPVARIV